MVRHPASAPAEREPEMRLRRAYEECQRFARAHYENFPVGSLLVPRAIRRHVAAVYAFARVADDFADEGTLRPEDRHRLLEGWQRRLRLAVESPGAAAPAVAGEPGEARAIFLALGATIRETALPVELFEDLLSAFRQDVDRARYSTWEDLLDYCRRSANPVGRLVLRLAYRSSPQLDIWSDAICTALQLTNFWQDLTVDLDRGRLYLPASLLQRHGAAECDLAPGAATDGARAAFADAIARTRLLFERGRPLCDAVPGRLRYELRATWLGGTRILERLERRGLRVAHDRPTLGPRDVPWLVWRMAMWPAGAQPGGRQVAV